MVKLIKKNKSKSEIIDGIKEYSKLRQKMQTLGVFDRAYGFYTALIIFIFSGFFLTAYLLIILKSIPLLILLGLLFSFFTVQMAGLLHDAGHRTIFNSSLNNDILGHICGILLAMGYSSWKINHNKHHAHPNQEEEDPDVSIPLFSFTEERFSKKTGIIEGFIKRYQSYLYFPLGSLVGFSVRAASVKYFLTNFNKKTSWEFIFLCLAIITWFVLPFFLFNIQKSIILFTVINLSVGFYLLNVFAPNHKGMPQFAKNVKISFMEQQIMTSRNIYGNWLTDFIYMGLNYQIEHHLFPNTPRNKLKMITPFVLRICKKRNLEFTQTGIIESNKIILSELYNVEKNYTRS